MQFVAHGRLWATFSKINITNEKHKQTNKNKRKISFDFSKYEVFEKRKDLITYKYSNSERASKQKLVQSIFL